MAAEEPLVSTPGTQAGLLNYQQVAPRVFKGPQGPGLQDFLELHNEETSLCHLGVLRGSSRSRFVSPKAKKLVVEADAGTGKGPSQNISETYVLSDEGRVALSVGQGAEKVYFLELRCQGGYHRGDSKGSGANCVKVAAELGWCSSMGDVGCPQDCLLSPSVLRHSVNCSRGDVGNRKSKCDDPNCNFEKEHKMISNTLE